MQTNLYRFIASIMLLISTNVFAQSWDTVDFAGFDEVVRIEISTNYPVQDPAMDNIILDDGSMGFEGFIFAGPDEVQIPLTPYVESGFTLNADALEHGLFGPASGVNTNGSNIFGWCGACLGSITMDLVQVGDAPFDLLSIDFSVLNIREEIDEPLPSDITFIVVGYFADGSTISQQYVYAVTGPEAVAIPVNAPMALLLMALMLMGAGAWKFRRSA